jgi:hypothetical protein
MVRGAVRVGPDGPPNGIDGGLVPLRLVGDHPQEMKRIRVFRVHPKDSAVHLFGLRKPTRLMFTEGDAESFRYYGHRRTSLSDRNSARSSTDPRIYT